MHVLAPEGSVKRQPGHKKRDITRVALVSIGPFHELSADGHEKLNAQALRMGDISLPIYGYRDKWSGYLVHMSVLPDSRNAAPMAHVYLDLVEQYGGESLANLTSTSLHQNSPYTCRDPDAIDYRQGLRAGLATFYSGLTSVSFDRILLLIDLIYAFQTSLGASHQSRCVPHLHGVEEHSQHGHRVPLEYFPEANG
jgi:hypothetical protein